jgi:hypothetical protein
MRRPAGRGREAPSASEVAGERPPQLRAAAGIAGGDGVGTGTLDSPAERTEPNQVLRGLVLGHAIRSAAEGAPGSRRMRHCVP